MILCGRLDVNIGGVRTQLVKYFPGKVEGGDAGVAGGVVGSVHNYVDVAVGTRKVTQ